MLYVSVHIPKTAGTSFAKALGQAFEEDELVLDYRHARDHAELAARGVGALETHRAWLSPGWLDLARRYRQDINALPKGCKLVHGHFPVRKYHPLMTWRKPFYITWVRDPFARAVSNYFYWQSFDPEHMPDPLVRTVLSDRWSLEDFLFHPALQNYQSLFLRGVPWQRIDFIGVVERFPEDLKKLSAMIGRPLEQFMENTGPVSGAVETHEHLRAHFMEFHEEDTALYHYAVDRSKRAQN
ncbi:hypothetical protein [uncultured Marivita sp.]|uniref:hypothetical protein n=1 Tax=uncultured Marivita sp. TaxID=888080 RepID=UPI00260FA20E|nr:hypothetical protein [uncultured Marivita sp.]